MGLLDATYDGLAMVAICKARFYQSVHVVRVGSTLNPLFGILDVSGKLELDVEP